MASSAASTPLMEQYGSVKAQYPGHLVLFRVGDFYETFGDDAKLLSREVEVVLTARSPDARGERTPMAGVPYHAVESYLNRLVRKGYKVALCDQVEDARFAKGLVRREVTRVVTPGTVIEDRILPGPEHNFLVALQLPSGAAGSFAAVDVTTGELFARTAMRPGVSELLATLAPFSPREVLVPAESSGTEGLERALRADFPGARIEVAPPPMDRSDWPSTVGTGVESLPPGELEAIGRATAYVRATQPRLLPFLERLAGPAGAGRLKLDGKTLRHLEVTRPMNPDEAATPTLLSTWDETVTPPGRRTLAFWLRNPLADVGAIRHRQDAVAALAGMGPGLEAVREELHGVADLSRIAARVAGRRLRPQELGALRHSLRVVTKIVDRWGGGSSPIASIVGALDPLPTVAERLARALPEELPPTVEGGHLFRPGYAGDLDRWTREGEEAEQALEALERSEAAATGIRSLKIGYNQVFGYYFEVTRPNLARVPPHFRRKQTLSGAERFTSDALSALEERILTARERSSEAERELWERFLGELEAEIPRIHRLSRSIGELDALASFARIARDRGYVRPEIDDGGAIQIREGRHPVLDRILGERYVPNETDLDIAGTRLLVLTGPNMSGKSTYMRQVGLIVLLAQVGAFVPARFAHIGVVSALFTRMGFTDEIARGKSSFMVEMTEVADILRGADGRSLVLLDEVGRGTSTFDGLAIAWATLKEIHDAIGCRTILATHYHQLTELVAALPGAANGHLAVRDEDGEVVFLHRLVPGSTDRSYGLHVARLAGLPPSLVKEADDLLRRLERENAPLARGGKRGARPVRYTQAILLAAEQEGVDGPGAELLRALLQADPERMTPIEALHWIAEWRKKVEGPSEREP